MGLTLEGVLSKRWRHRKKSNICVAIIPSSLRRTTSTPQDTEFRAPWSWTFYGAVRQQLFTWPSCVVW